MVPLNPQAPTGALTGGGGGVATQVVLGEGREAAYKLTSTVMLQLNTKVGAQLSGSLTRQVGRDGADPV